MRAAFATLLTAFCCVAWSPAMAEEGECRGLEGLYEFTGQLQPRSLPFALGIPPNIGLILFPGSSLAYDDRFDRYRVANANGRFQLELLTSHGARKSVSMVDEKDFFYCMNDELTIERQQRSLAGQVLEYSRYRHKLRRLDSGDLEVETEITGRFRTWLLAWDKPPEMYAVRFALVAPRR